MEEHDGAHARNTGRVDVEKGHLMALELGGPDIPANIVPQWAKFQGCGAWRQMEVELKARAEQVMAASGGQNALHFELTVHYSPVDESMATLNQLCFPVGFTVTATERRLADGQLVPNGYQQTWIVNQEQDETDNRLAYRNDVTLAIREGFSAAPFLDDDGVAADPAKRREVVTRLLSAEWAALHKAPPLQVELDALLAGQINIYKDVPPAEPDMSDFVPPDANQEIAYWREVLSGQLDENGELEDDDWVDSDDESDGDDSGSDDDDDEEDDDEEDDADFDGADMDGSGSPPGGPGPNGLGGGGSAVAMES